MLFRSNRIREISRKMLGNMKPSEIVELVSEPDVKNSDVPAWVDLVIEEYCKIFTERCSFYESRFEYRYGRNLSLIAKMDKYRTVWVNWDGLEPFPWREERPIKYFFDENIEDRTRNYALQ